MIFTTHINIVLLFHGMDQTKPIVAVVSGTKQAYERNPFDVNVPIWVNLTS